MAKKGPLPADLCVDHLSDEEKAKAMDEVTEMEKECCMRERNMNEKHGAYNTAKQAYSEACNALRETIRSYGTPLPMFDKPKNEADNSENSNSKEKTAKKKVAKKKAKRGGLKHPAVDGATGQGKAS